MVVFSDGAFSSSFPKLHSTSPRLPGAAAASKKCRIFSDVAGDVTIVVDGQPFLLHKFPLVSQSGKLRRMFMESRDPDPSRLELCNVPGGAVAFELATRFCYGGTNLEITPANVARLRCVAEFLEMTEDYRDDNLVSRTEDYLNDVVLRSLDKSVEVLCTCEALQPVAEEVGILDRCVEAIAVNASKEQLVTGLARLECDGGPERLKKMDCQDWWLDDLLRLKIEPYRRVVAAMRRTGVRPDSISASIVGYAQAALKGVERRHSWDSAVLVGEEQRAVVESLVGLLSAEKAAPSVPTAFLFGMLRMSIAVGAAPECRMELERRVGYQLPLASLDDMLIPSLQATATGESSVFDIDTARRILVSFLQRIEEDDEGGDDSDESPPRCGYESEDLRSPSHGSILKVGRLMDGYLAEIAPDPCLKLQKFMAIIELLPDYARVIDDGLYRAVDIYLKAHPSLTETECKSLCSLIDCSKLTQDAANHAAMNDRLPVQTTVRVLYFEQLRIKSSLSGNGGVAGTASNDCLFFSQRMTAGGGGGGGGCGSGAPSAAVSPRDNYASLRRENRELRLEVSRMRARLSELEKEQAFMKKGMRDGRPSDHGRAFLKGIAGRIGIFGGGGGNGQQQQQQRGGARKARGGSPDGKHRRRNRRSSM